MKSTTRTKRAPTPVRAVKNSQKAIENAQIAISRLEQSVTDLQTLVQATAGSAMKAAPSTGRKPGRKSTKAAATTPRRTPRARKQNGNGETAGAAGTLL